VVLKGFERRLERMVEGTFARLFRSGLRPVELGRKLAREMDTGRSIGVGGSTVVPNDFTVSLSQDDYDNFTEIHDTLCRELADAAREHARDEQYRFMGPVDVQLAVGPKIRSGSFTIDARLKEGPGGVGAGSLVLPNNDRILLSGHTFTIGRLPECDLTINDKNVSRNHAEIHPHGDGFKFVDLGSTNGSRINGIRVNEQELQDGDEITIGATQVLFQAS
jgi:FhaA, N-terminal domain/FHA domain